MRGYATVVAAAAAARDDNEMCIVERGVGTTLYTVVEEMGDDWVRDFYC